MSQERMNRKLNWLGYGACAMAGCLWGAGFFFGKLAFGETTVSHAALMVGTMPVLLALGATIFSGERLDWVGWLALAGSTVGAALIVLGGHEAGTTGVAPTLTGDLLVVLSLVIALGWVLMNKSLMEVHGPLQVTAYGILSGTAMLAA